MNTFLFDLDGTLLPMDQDYFVDLYFKGIAAKLLPYGIDSKILIKTVWEGTKAMIANDGTMNNSQRFWNTASDILGKNILDYEPVFYDYYKNEFQEVKKASRPSGFAKECIKKLKSKGYRLVLATNPLFPQIATHSRIRWAGLEPEDFDWITTYENSSYCKPNIKYYKEILQNIGANPKQCIMIGNDVSEDMVASSLGMNTFLVTDCLINSEGEDISQYEKGSLKDLLEYIKELPGIN
ncbi:HAD family hydrolase [Herbinix luporum]|jgi:FMN phosphatase YigB (HAD superfamily)|uniref:HAD family hydrolase n=1 Tax=Herbinix luporum TaxID=1679721 RepID=A0A0K8J4W6_9FIRM|nr:HAD family hydrolase [Herbinix luporum]MDI9489688.1 HAD family hydrolase [Bacillota bacterium]CUH92525.1 hypothetical protein SD1D_0978 [Herbinix luporum]HHT57910.1 HAD family hydrolase [Herbinix luporum]